MLAQLPNSDQVAVETGGDTRMMVGKAGAWLLSGLHSSQKLRQAVGLALMMR